MRLPFTLDRPLVFLDLETTGLSVSQDRIIELAIIKVMPQGDVLERVRRFNPGMRSLPRQLPCTASPMKTSAKNQRSRSERGR